MKLLVVTQRVHKHDHVLGFFHGWLRRFSGECETLTVIGQSCKHHELSPEVHVHSLGKERHLTKAAQIIRFWRLAWSLRGHYDTVFIHMTPVWAVLGAPLFLPLRKRVFLWYEAKGGGMWLKMATVICRKVFSASEHGMPLDTKKSVVTGHGIDVDFFSDMNRKRDMSMTLTVGRITESKHIDVPIKAHALLPDTWRLQIVGACVTDADRAYRRRLQSVIDAERIEHRIEWKVCTPEKLLESYRTAGFLLHASETPLDKVVLEAMACGCIVLSTSEAMRDVLPATCHVADECEMADRLKEMSSWPADQRRRLIGTLRNEVVTNHSLDALIRRLVDEMRPSTEK